MSEIDFTKPLEFDQDFYRVLSVFPVRFSNSRFAHAVHYRQPNGSEAVSAVTRRGEVNSLEGLVLRNVPPKIVDEVFVNVYASGFAGCTCKSMSDANNNVVNVTWGDKRTGVLHTAIYDDGQVQQKLIQL
jgi:hypothetical protein